MQACCAPLTSRGTSGLASGSSSAVPSAPREGERAIEALRSWDAEGARPLTEHSGYSRFKRTAGSQPELLACGSEACTRADADLSQYRRPSSPPRISSSRRPRTEAAAAAAKRGAELTRALQPPGGPSRLTELSERLLHQAPCKKALSLLRALPSRGKQQRLSERWPNRARSSEWGRTTPPHPSIYQPEAAGQLDCFDMRLQAGTEVPVARQRAKDCPERVTF